jgi:hypothetical protein
MAFTGKTRLYDQILIVILMITGLCLLTTCSNAKFAGNGSSEQGGEDNKTTEQPTDIAGGFGLTCLPADIENSSSDYNVGCRFTTVDGSQLKPSDSFDFDVKVKNNQNEVSIRKEPKGEKYTFDFDVPKTDISQVKIESAAKETNSSETIKAMVFELSKVVTLPTAPNECGGPNNSCYAPHNLKDRKYGDVKTITGTTERISYVTVGGRPYWMSLTRGTNRFLNFSGFWDPAKKLGWQMYLTPDGRTFDDSKYLVDADLYHIHGRACPGRVFTGGDDAGETGRCIYYKSLNLSNLKAGGVPESWTDKKWFSTNHSACAALGMRLPTLYELDAFKDASQDVDLPPNPSTIRAVGGTGIVYAGGYTTYSILTATTGTKGASKCGGDDCYAGVVNGMVSTYFNPDSSISDGTLYCVLH